MARAGSTAIDPGTLQKLGRRYIEQEMFDEAIRMFEMAGKLQPGSAAVEIQLNRARELQSRARDRRYRDLEEKVRSSRSRAEVDAAQYVGLAGYYIEKKETTKAVELLEIARHITPSNYRAFEMLGRHYYDSGEWGLAEKEVQRARTLNPFDRGLAELAGRVAFENDQLERSLENFVDAFLLSTDQKGEETEPVRRMINTLKGILGVENVDLNEIINGRVENLRMNTERLELRKESLVSPGSGNQKLLERIKNRIDTEAARIEESTVVANRLRELGVFSHIREDQVDQLSRFVRRRDLADGEQLFFAGERSMDFLVVLSGALSIQKETPFGPQHLARLIEGEIVGEMNFIDRSERSTDAFAVGQATVAGFSFTALDKLMDSDKELAVGLHWAFWRSLTVKVRDANEQLKSFFQDEASQEARKHVESTAETQRIEVKSEDKVDLFRERGLSAAEMKLLATFSAEERVQAGSVVFREGDRGDKLYIILDGRVRISKFIPGVGEEALAVLDRGDFFGEMALIDDEPRSADAKAHEVATTVLSIDRATLNEILSMDPSASLQFLNLLCRMISRRLREINDKIVQWKYMSGGF